MQRELVFDAPTGEQLKQAGMAQSADNKASLLKYARKTAVLIALSRATRECCADCVQMRLAQEGISDRALGSAAGSLFSGKAWQFTGRRCKSRRPHAHANELKIWKYVGTETKEVA